MYGNCGNKEKIKLWMKKEEGLEIGLISVEEIIDVKCEDICCK